MNEVLEISFQNIEPIWKNQLWPERTSKIEPTSWINHQGKIDLKLSLGSPTFFGVFKERSNLVGVVSGFKTSPEHYRSRGLWVHPDHRGHGLGILLMNRLTAQARIENSSVLWTMPRHSAWGFYKTFGFINSGLVTEFEYGPHFLAELELR